MSLTEIGGGYKKPIIRTTEGIQVKEVQKKEDTDQVTLNGETLANEMIDPKAVMENLKEGKIDFLKDFASKNSTWGAFIAGIAAGLADRANDKKTLTYLEQVKANMQKMTENKGVYDKAYDKIKGRHILADMTKSVAECSTLLGIFFGGAWGLCALLGKASMVTTLAPMLTGIGIGGLSELINRKLTKKSDKLKLDVVGERFIPLKDNNFLTIPPDNKKILWCQIAKDEVTGETYPSIRESLDLPGEPSSISDIKFIPNPCQHFDNYEATIKYKDPKLLSKVKIYNYKWEVINRDITHTNWDDFEEKTK